MTDPKDLPEERVLALTLYAEARGDDVVATPEQEGYDAVLCVLLNRAFYGAQHMAHGSPHPLYGDGTVKSACLQRLQFSCWNADDPQRPTLVGRAYSEASDRNYAWALAVAQEGLRAGTPGDVTGGATHYITKAAFAAAPASHWCKSSEMVRTYETPKQMFFRVSGTSTNPRNARA